MCILSEKGGKSMNTGMIKTSLTFLTLCLISLIPLTGTYADTGKPLSTGGTVYVSIYSNVFSGPKAIAVQLAGMLSVRNVDPKFPITIVSADYYNSSGKRIGRYIKEATELKPLASTHYYIKEYDTAGGSGANFLVKWRSKNGVNKPIIEGIMINTRSGLTFRCPGVEITEHKE
jgi:hypothetical protein